LVILGVYLIKLLKWVLWTLLPRSPLILVGVVAESPVLSYALHSDFLGVSTQLVVSTVSLAVLEELPVELGYWLHLLEFDSKFLFM
jgi:hypothetical protein